MKELDYLSVLDRAASKASLTRGEHQAVVESINRLKKFIEDNHQEEESEKQLSTEEESKKQLSTEE